ncbi:o-succinylbenzoate synthase [Naasia lichenicola]|uniref:o-succinylbenzoate synthase n=1 Tax=Naasia lichenicola TaxID=2565933 RepID=A0A4S4FLJ5_9MICO|nr:o-succinylbenzoate synthase [Naasia lichenicola]THG31058.1 O-succinylbenzoate synthase [Naasia lichenicola]
MDAFLSDVLSGLRVVSLPLATRFRGLTVRETAVFEGPMGWTEFSPFVEYDDDEASRWLAAAYDFGWTAAPPGVRERIMVNATMPAVAAAQVPEILARFSGCRTVKVKVAEPGTTLADDVARVAEVRRMLGAEGRIRIDANGAWNVDEAEHAIRELSVFDLEYVEQPCAHTAELQELEGRIDYLDVPIAVDEGLRKALDPLGAARELPGRVVIVKAAPLGGIRSALAIATASGRPAVVSSALESSIGLSMGLHLAAALPELDYDCGLGTAALLAADVTDDPLLPENGAIEVRRVAPRPALLDAFAADAERTSWWRERITRCHALLQR